MLKVGNGGVVSGREQSKKSGSNEHFCAFYKVGWAISGERYIYLCSGLLQVEGEVVVCCMLMYVIVFFLRFFLLLLELEPS